MDKQDIQMWSVQAQLPQDYVTGEAMWIDRLEHFAALVAAAEREEFAKHAVKIARKAVAEEREACAKVCEGLEHKLSNTSYTPNGFSCANAIRARGQA